MALIDQYHLAHDQEFAFRVEAALVNALALIESEPSTTTGHTTRLQWCKAIKDSPGTLVAQLAYGCTCDATILGQYTTATPPLSGAVQDADISRVVSALITTNVGV